MKLVRLGLSIVWIAVLSTLAAGAASATTTDMATGNVPQITPERPGLSVLLPAQSFPVAPDLQEPPGQELALDPLDEDPLVASPAETQTAYQLDWQPGVDWMPSMQSVGGSRQLRAHYRLGQVHPIPGWKPDTGRFSYVQENGSSIAIGQVDDTGSFWGNSPRLGGVQVTRLPGVSSRGTLLPGALGLSAAIGRISQEDLGQTGSGGLTVGAPIASSTLRYGMTPDFTLESHLQSAADTSEKGLGGMVALGDWGALRMSTTQVQDILSQSQRSGLGLQVKLDQQQFESSYESLRTGSGGLEQKLGFKHSWFLTPQTRVQIGGDREFTTGNYSMKMQFSLPLDALGAHWWRD
jgi:hypothetical protein